jgi:2-keto-4-pentenoate hydratase/2-oxohepta-3-ene-1,7-dioic acid hydratase in catechol pathway
MRIARYADGDRARTAVVDAEQLRPLAEDVDVLAVLALTPDERAALRTADPIPLDPSRLLAPLSPPALRDFVTFESHVQGVNKSVNGSAGVPEAWYEAPVFVFMNPHGVMAPNADIPMPPFTSALDFELEVAAIVGSRVRDAGPDDAERFIAGYAVLNDWSTRDVQRREMQVGLGPSKGKDFATTIGPWITTPDELEPWRTGDRYDLRMEVFVNGELIGSDSMAHMAWSFSELLVHASRDAWVGAGDVLATGTCGGGALAESWGRRGEQTPRPLQVGDVVTMTVEGLGTIESRITETTSPGHRAPEARRL